MNCHLVKYQSPNRRKIKIYQYKNPNICIDSYLRYMPLILLRGWTIKRNNPVSYYKSFKVDNKYKNIFASLGNFTNNVPIFAAACTGENTLNY